MTKIQMLASIVAVIVGCIILVLILINQGVLNLSIGLDENEKKSKQFDTAIIERKDLRKFIDLNGILDYGNNIPISPSDSGILTYIAPEGSELKRGSVIFRFYKSISDIDKETNKQQIASANAAVAAAELTLENLKAPATPAQISSADAAVAGAELALENLKAPATSVQIASADAAVAGVELALENLKTPATPAQIVSADVAITAAELALENLKAPATPAQIASANAVVAGAELTLENLKATATPAQIASANAAVAAAEFMLENLKATATPAQIAAADAAVTLASINHTTTLGALDVGKVSRRIARKSLCDRAYELMNSDLAHLNSICPAIDIPIPDTAIKTLMDKMFAFSDDLMISRSSTLINSYQNYQSLELTVQTAAVSLSSARNNREELNNLASNTQLTQAKESLKAAKEQQKALDNLPNNTQLTQATESLKAAKEQQQTLNTLPSDDQLQQALDLLQVAKEQRKALNDLPTTAQLKQATESLKAAKEQRKALNDLPTTAQLKQATESLKAAKEQRKTLNNLPGAVQLRQAQLSLESAKSSLSTALTMSKTLKEGTLASVLMYGDVSAWREFREGMTPGKDIKQLEENLYGLGYADFGITQIDEVFDSSTTNSIKKMQADLELIETGSIAIGDVVFLPGTSIVQSSSSFPSLGANVQPNVSLLSLRTTEKIKTTIEQEGNITTTVESLQRVKTSIEVADKELIRVGSKVKVELPDESIVSGTINEIASIAVWPQGNQIGNPFLQISASIDGNIVFHQWTGAIVTVSITETLVEGVLAVPIPSLVVLLGGGYALEVLEGDSIKLVPVETGVYDDGWVEVKGEGLTEGAKVIVAGGS